MEAVTALLSRTTCGITLDKEDLTFLRVLDRAVGKLARETTAGHEVLALNTLASLAGCDTSCSCQDDLFADALCLVWMLLQVVCQSLVYCLLYGTLYLTVTQLGLGLSLKLWLCYLDGDDCGQTLSEVLWCNLYLGFLYLLGDSRVSLGVCLECTGQRHTETCEVSTTLNGIDVVDV